MEDISFYFSPIDSSVVASVRDYQLGTQIDVHTQDHFPDLQQGAIAIFYAPEYRRSTQKHCGSEKFREQLYHLFVANNWKTKMIDLGNVLPGQTVDDTYFAIGEIVAYLVKKQIIPLLVGGSQDLTVAMYKGYEKLEQFVNLCTVDARLDMGHLNTPIHNEGYLSHLLFDGATHLFNITNLGMQIPLVAKNDIDLFDDLYFDICRLGELTEDIKKVEPHLRNTDLLSIDLTSVRFADLNDSHYTNPNGFYSEQICRIARYAGISDKLTSIGLFNYFPEQTENSNISSLVAQIIWYFIDGVNARMGDFPIGTRKNYTQFIVHTSAYTEDIIFYKSNKSARWWMEVPYPAKGKRKYERHYLVPCNYEDYQKAMKNEIPDLWWKTYQKLV